MSRMKLKLSGSFSQLNEVVRIVSPGGLWVRGIDCEYYTRRGPIIRYRPIGIVTVHGDAGPAGQLFDSLFRALKNRQLIRGDRNADHGR
jgi:hypothetical protein